MSAQGCALKPWVPKCPGDLATLKGLRGSAVNNASATLSELCLEKWVLPRLPKRNPGLELRTLSALFGRQSIRSVLPADYPLWNALTNARA